MHESSQTPLKSLVNCGTRLWLDSVDPDLISLNKEQGATGATSNPIIIANLIRSGRFDEHLTEFLEQGLTDEDAAWGMTDKLVSDAESQFIDVYRSTAGNDGYVSFELDPLLEDKACPLTLDEKVSRYVELGTRWAVGHPNRMIKVPATPAGLEALESLVAQGVTVNVTLIFTARQYQAARDAVWRGAQRRDSFEHFKSAFSIFVSRVDVYTKQHASELSAAAQGIAGLLNAKRIANDNREFWLDKNLPLDQEIIFASTGTKDPSDPSDKYIAALAGSDIQTNPPEMNAAIQASQTMFTRQVDQLPAENVIAEIDRVVDFEHLENTMMEDGLAKFADPHKSLIALIHEKR